MKSLDSVIEESVARLPGMGWFDSRRSGDVVGYAHKVLWVSACSGLAWLLSLPAWYGGAAYVVVYVGLRKIPGTLKAYRKWKRSESKLGPWKDHRSHASGIHFGYAVDSLLDILFAVGTTLVYYWLGR